MTRSTAFAALALALPLAAGCASNRIPMTQELRAQHGLTRTEMLNLQYYSSHEITLRRQVETSGKQITEGHKLVVKSGITVEEVVIDAGTPGVAVDVGTDFIAVSFERGTVLTFALRGASVPFQAGPAETGEPAPDPFPGNPRAAEPPPPRDLSTSLTGAFWIYPQRDDRFVWFGGRWFEAVEETLQAHLLIDAESLEEEQEEQKVLGGVKL
jgi:hypothetical protein